MFAAGQKDMQLMDQYTMETLGLPGVVLMENAGAKVVEEILLHAPCKNLRAVVLAGGGNNGGDGFVIARRLADHGLTPLLCLLVDPAALKGDALCHYKVYANRGLPVLPLWERKVEALKHELLHADVIVDAMMGTGVRGEPREPFYQVISMVNDLKGEKPVIAVDIPSGLNSDDGIVEGTAIMATKTITFVFPKKGFFLKEGPLHTGEWKAVDISVPPDAAGALGLDLPRVITDSSAKAALPPRAQNGHKGTFGHALVVGGSRPYAGAPVFTAKAVLYSGAGLVTLAIPDCIYPAAAAQFPEALFFPLPEEAGHFSSKGLAELTERLPQYKSVAIGPGMSRFPGGEEWVKGIITSLSGQPIVVDADALYLLRNSLDVLRQYKGPVILTPHPGEMAVLLNKSVKEAEEDRLETARQFARDYQVFLLLKGHRSIIATPAGDLYINPYGHDALGKGGSGDVLTGLIASFLAQGAAPISALISASYVHARAGEEKAKTLSRYGVLPTDLIEGAREQLLLLSAKGGTEQD